MSAGEGHLLHLGEQPEARLHLAERLEGRQISGVYWTDELGGPRGWASVGFELTTSETVAILAAPAVGDPRWTTRLAIRWLEAERGNWTRSMDERYRLGHGRAEPGDWLKRQIQGQVVRHVRMDRVPTTAGGERMVWECSGGDRLILVAEPSGEHPMQTALDLQVVRPGRVIRLGERRE